MGGMEEEGKRGGGEGGGEKGMGREERVERSEKGGEIRKEGRG